MTTYVLRNGQLIEKSKAPPKSGVFVVSDINPFVTQDGKEISSRSSLREYEQRNGVKQIGNDMASQTAALRRQVFGDNA